MKKLWLILSLTIILPVIAYQVYMPENYTYNRDDELKDIEKVEKVLKAYF